MKRLLIIADHTFVVQFFRLALRQTAGFQVVATLDGRVNVRHRVSELRPEVVVIDEMQNHQDALSRLQEAAEEAPDAKVLLLSSTLDEERLDGAFEAGAHAVLAKTLHPVALGTLLRETARGNVVHRYRARKPADAENPLTSREVQILGLAAQGYTNARIGRELWVTEQTVKFHLSNTYRKLGVTNRTEASRYAYMHHLVADEPLAS